MSPINVQLSARLRLIAFVSLLVLIFSNILWEGYVAPIRPGSSWLAIKVIPLIFMIRGVWKGNLYTMQWGSMLVLLYFMEGVTRALSDPNPSSRLMARFELFASLAFFISSLAYLRPAKKAAKRAKRLLPVEQETPPAKHE